MENLEAIIQLIDSWLWGRWLVFVLLALGILYTISNGFIQVRHFGFIIRRTLIDSYNTRHEDKGNGSISTFKAMMVTLAGNPLWRHGCRFLDVGSCLFRHGFEIR